MLRSQSGLSISTSEPVSHFHGDEDEGGFMEDLRSKSRPNVNPYIVLFSQLIHSKAINSFL